MFLVLMPSARAFFTLAPQNTSILFVLTKPLCHEYLNRCSASPVGQTGGNRMSEFGSFQGAFDGGQLNLHSWLGLAVMFGVPLLAMCGSSFFRIITGK